MVTGYGKRNGRCKRLFALGFAIFFMFRSLTAYAADVKILSTIAYDGNIYVYIRGVSELQPDSSIQIGNVICQSEQISSALLNSSGILMRTIILVDNSKSIPSKNHADIQEIIEGLLSSSAENEQFKIGTFSEQATYLCDYTNNKEILSNVVSAITYNDQDTYLSDVLHDVISELESENICAYTRIFIIADGADDNPNGWTSDEVRMLIGESVYPVYTVGIPGKNNSAELEKMFSFSRASGSEYFLLDEETSNADVVNALEQDQDGICIRIAPDESIKDGSNKSILLKLSMPEGSIELKTSVDMPFGSGISEAPDEENISENDKGSEKDETEYNLPKLEPGGEKGNVTAEESETVSWIPIAVIAAIVLLTAGGIILFVFMKKKKKAASVQKEPEPSSENEKPVSGNDDADTVMMGDTKTDNATPLWKGYDMYLILKCLDDTNIMFKEPITDVLSIGRSSNRDIVIDDAKLSKKHCEIRLRSDLLYIKDCNSTNGTKYEGVSVYDDEKPIVSGGKIEMGGHSYRVELVKE